MGVKEDKIRWVYGDVIFKRGLKYFREDRVTSVLKLQNRLIGEVIGTDRYKTEVNLDDFNCRCSCPYGENCKHGVAVLLQYLNGEYVDGDDIMREIEESSRDELLGIIEKLIEMNPENLLYFTVTRDTSEKQVKALDKQIKTMLNSIRYNYADKGFVERFSRLIKTNEDVITKEQIFYILNFLVRNSEEYGCFYDDYADDYFGDNIFESLCDAFTKKGVGQGRF